MFRGEKTHQKYFKRELFLKKRSKSQDSQPYQLRLSCLIYEPRKPVISKQFHNNLEKRGFTNLVKYLPTPDPKGADHFSCLTTSSLHRTNKIKLFRPSFISFPVPGSDQIPQSSKLRLPKKKKQNKKITNISVIIPPPTHPHKTQPTNLPSGFGSKKRG